MTSGGTGAADDPRLPVWKLQEKPPGMGMVFGRQCRGKGYHKLGLSFLRGRVHPDWRPGPQIDHPNVLDTNRYQAGIRAKVRGWTNDEQPSNDASHRKSLRFRSQQGLISLTPRRRGPGCYHAAYL